MGCTSSQPKGKKMMGKSPSVSASDPHVFLAVNGSSGGLVAKELLDMSLPRFSMRLDDDSTVWVSIFNLKDEDAREQGFQEAAELVKNGTNVRVVACGGDGTVKWVISCLARHSALEIPIGVIPFGTGNDLSRVMGWGSKPPSPLIGVALKALRAKIQTIFDAEQIPLDVWICTIDIGDSANAKFEEVKDKKIVQTHHDKKSLSHEMINYFSLGADGQLMFGFEQNRTSSQAANKRVYAQQGFYQTISRPNRLSKYVKDVKFSTNHDGELGPLDFKRRDRQLLFLNIPSYAAGADLWGTPSSSKTGNGVELTPQFVGDQKVEVLTIRSTSDVGLSLSTGSKFGIRRTTQGQRFQIEFEANTDAYFQIDGEALKACDVRTVSVRHGFQVQMLKSKKGKAVAFPAGFVPPVRHATEEEANAKEMASAMDESRASLADSSNLGTSVKATGIEASSRALLSKRHLVTANDSEASELDAADDGQLPTVDEETSQENGDLTKTNGHSQNTTASTEENESVQAVDATVTSKDVSLSSENNDAVTISASKETDESTTNTSSTTKETDESTISKKGKEDSSITNADEPPNSSTAATTT